MQGTHKIKGTHRVILLKNSINNKVIRMIIYYIIDILKIEVIKNDKFDNAYYALDF